MRRSELAALQHADLENYPKGLIVYKRRSKTDQQSQGKHIEVAYGKHNDTCAVIATRQWLDHANIITGPLFRPVNKAGTIDHTRSLAPKQSPASSKKHVTRIGHAKSSKIRVTIRSSASTHVYSPSHPTTPSTNCSPRRDRYSPWEPKKMD